MQDKESSRQDWTRMRLEVQMYMVLLTTWYF